MGIEPTTSRTLNENHTTRPLALAFFPFLFLIALPCIGFTLPPGIEPGTYRLTADRSAC